MIRRRAAIARRVRPRRRSATVVSRQSERDAARAQAYALDGGRCVFPPCRRALSLNQDGYFPVAHGHEVLPRSLGGSPYEVDNIATLCPWCHADVHPRIGGVRKRVTGTRLTGFGFWERPFGETVWVNVNDPTT